MCLKVFELISGLKINMSKSCMVDINVEEQKLRELANGIGCRMGNVPFWEFLWVGSVVPSLSGTQLWRTSQKSLPTRRKGTYPWGGGGSP